MMLTSISARAGEISISLDENSQKTAAQLPALLDMCIAGITLRNDPSACKGVSASLNGLAGMVKTAQDNAVTEAAKAKPAAADPK